jgi:hypothetical protein
MIARGDCTYRTRRGLNVVVRAWSLACQVFRTKRPLGDVEAPLLVDELCKVDGADRKWIEALLAAGRVREDARLPAALARLDARSTLPALDAVAATAEPGDFRDAVAAARRSLASPPN